MVVLAAIGRFFKKIWDWIKQTAWIQPLLIVGIIFGVIFSIPSIVKAVNASKKEKSTYAAYYHNYKLSLEGGEDSEADKFTYDLYNVMNNENESTLKSFRDAHGDLGDKFFVVYVEKECPKCEEAKEGFKKFQDDFSKYVDKDETNSFNLVTIFADDETSETEENQSAFIKYLERHQDFFQEIGSRASEFDYVKGKHVEESDVNAMEIADPKEFLTPTVFLVELGGVGKSEEFGSGVTELMFGVNGSDKYSKAMTLSDCWRHAGDFSLDSND